MNIACRTLKLKLHILLRGVFVKRRRWSRSNESLASWEEPFIRSSCRDPAAQNLAFGISKLHFPLVAHSEPQLVSFPLSVVIKSASTKVTRCCSFRGKPLTLRRRAAHLPWQTRVGIQHKNSQKPAAEPSGNLLSFPVCKKRDRGFKQSLTFGRLKVCVKIRGGAAFSEELPLLLLVPSVALALLPSAVIACAVNMTL